MSRYYRSPVPEGEFDRRFLDQELTRISDSTVDISSELQGLLSINAEHIILRGSTTLLTDTLIDYASFFKGGTTILPDRAQLISHNLTAGTITIGYDGDYDISASVNQSGGTNGSTYTWAIDVSGSEFIIGSQVFATGVPFSAYAQTSVALTAGDVVKITAIDTLGGVVISNSNLDVKLIGFG